MTTQAIYHLVPVSDRWNVVQDGEVMKSFPAQDAAIRYIRRLARLVGDIRLVVHTWDFDLDQVADVVRTEDGEVELVYHIPEQQRGEIGQ